VFGATGRRGVIRIRTFRDLDNVVIAVTDNGPGIPDQIRDLIFEPFFTTRDVGEGAGQGLFIARSVIVDKHGGQLTLETAPGEGTTFFVRLPIDGAADAAGHAA
jgi:signal transduction histidine kinase